MEFLVKLILALLKIRQQLQRILEILELLVINKDLDVIEKSKKLVTSILEYKSHRKQSKRFGVR